MYWFCRVCYLLNILRNIFGEKFFLEIDNTLYKAGKNGYNDNSQKIRKYLSSPKEASKIAEAAFLGASAMHDNRKPAFYCI